MKLCCCFWCSVHYDVIACTYTLYRLLSNVFTAFFPVTCRDILVLLVLRHLEVIEKFLVVILKKVLYTSLQVTYADTKLGAMYCTSQYTICCLCLKYSWHKTKNAFVFLYFCFSVLTGELSTLQQKWNNFKIFYYFSVLFEFYLRCKQAFNVAVSHWVIVIVFSWV